MDNVRILSLDLETFSSADLPKCGVYRYVEAPDFEILLFAYAFDDEEVKIVDVACGEPIPEYVLAALEDEAIIKDTATACICASSIPLI